VVRKIQFCALILFAFLLQTNVFAHPVDDVIRANKQFHSSIIGISVKEIESKTIMYQRDEKLMVHPASTLKFITSAAAVDYLGLDYQFKTIMYRNRDNLYLKLGADPLFSQQDMVDLIAKASIGKHQKYRELLIDETVIDNIPFGTGWQWDDNASVCFPQMSPYILNRNLFSIKAKVTPLNRVVLKYNHDYAEKVVNKLRYDSVKSNVITERNIFNDDPSVVVKGTINDDTNIYIPVKNPKQMYISLLKRIMKDNHVSFAKSIKYSKIRKLPTQTMSVSHTVKDILTPINTNSDNLSAEILIKHLGAYSTKTTGTTIDGLKLVEDYYASTGINMKNIQLRDASGASMNDYVTADFMTDALLHINESKNSAILKGSMADGFNGTFKGRVPDLNGKLKVKTGTLSNTSAVIGYMQAKSGKNFVFAIMLDNLPKDVDAKQFENDLLEAINQL